MTDDPVRVGTTIGREYAIAATLGFTAAELLAFTRNAIEVALVPMGRRTSLLKELQVVPHGAGACTSTE